MKKGYKRIILFILVSILVGVSVYVYKYKKVSDEISQIKEVAKNYEDIITKVQANIDKVDLKSLEYLKTSDKFMEEAYYYSIEAEVLAREHQYVEAMESVEKSIQIVKKYNKVNLLIEPYRQAALLSSTYQENKNLREYCARLLEYINNPNAIWASSNQKQQVEILVYTNEIILLCNNGIESQAKIYFELLDEIDLTGINEVVNRQIIYAKLIYSDAINDYKAVKKYAEQGRESFVKADEITGRDTKDAGLLNIAIADMNLGILEGVEEKILTSIDFYKRYNDKYNIGVAYLNLGKYYNKVNINEKSIYYINQSLELFNEMKLYPFIDEALDYIIQNGESYKQFININDIYTQSHDVKNIIAEQKEISYTLSDIIEINNEINEEKINMLEKQNQAINSKNNIIVIFVNALVIIVILLIGIYMNLIKQMKIRKEQEDKLQKMLKTDYLTGANTKRHGIESLGKLIDKKRNISIAIMDIDNFKSINDLYGHIFGDRVLALVSKILMKDLASNDFVIRFGGEEFICIFNCDHKDAFEIINKKRQEIENYLFDKGVSITVSGGLVKWTGESVNELIEKADKLLYKAKSSGKNKIEN